MGVIEHERGALGVDTRGAYGGATPILFLHGVGSDKSVWAPQLAHFGRNRRSLALDYPGYGESQLRADATRDDFAVAVIEAMDALEVERAHICGLSLGGVIAIAMHHLAPARCASLILADSFAVHPDGEAICARSIDASHAMPMRELAKSRASLLLGATASGAVRAQVIATMAEIDPHAYRLGAAAVWLADQRDRAAAISVPTLVLVGDEDRITPPALSEQLAALIPGAALTLISGAGHLANLEQPAAFNRAVDRFLSGPAATAEG
ncbi:MAG: alpha/beta fold hydrolase [Pseudomonadota bacterium]|nr:alpha/beta fold hydrolase [Pseudomonadota bacterium]